MDCVAGIDLGSTTTKAVLLDGEGRILGRGITNSRSNYALASRIALNEAQNNARFGLLRRELSHRAGGEDGLGSLEARVEAGFRRVQYLDGLQALKTAVMREASAERLAPIRQELNERLRDLFDALEADARATVEGDGDAPRSEFFRDEAGGRYSALAEERAGGAVGFETLMGLFDKAIKDVEAREDTLDFGRAVGKALELCSVEGGREAALPVRFEESLERASREALEPEITIGTGYGRLTLPFPKEHVRSEILCHGLGAHALFPGTRTALDIGGQDTKAIQVDEAGIVTSFQMNDRCAAGCGRYLGYIADEMSLGVHQLGPLALKSTRRVRISSTCTVFAGAELRDRLTLGQRREDILAGLHRAMILRAMALLARSGGIRDEFTFTGGVAKNPAAVLALEELVRENYGERRLNISADSIYMGALGAALFALRSLGRHIREVTTAS